MSDYALVRTRSALALSSCAPIGLTRTYSVPDLYVSFKIFPNFSVLLI